MKILSNFDTELADKVYRDYTKKYPKSEIIIIYRDKIFLVFYVILPLIIYAILITFLATITFFVDLEDQALNFIKWILLGISFFFSFFYFGWKILKKYIDYKLDFCVVSPNEIVAYNQTGIFTRTARTIDADKIKTISVNKPGIINSIFNLGTIKFLSEGDDTGSGDIQLYHVLDPDYVKSQIRNIIDLGEEDTVK